MPKNNLFLQLLFLGLAVLSFTPFISPPIALLSGIAFVNIFGKVIETDSFVKKLLQYSIVGLGFGINLTTAIEAGSQGFLFTVSTIILVMIIGLLLAKLLKLIKRLLSSFLQELQSVEEVPLQQLPQS